MLVILLFLRKPPAAARAEMSGILGHDDSTIGWIQVVLSIVSKFPLPKVLVSRTT